MKNLKRTTLFLLGFGLMAFIAISSSCSKENASSSSTLQVRLTDDPAAYQEVNIDLREVRVKFSDDSTNQNWVTLPTNARVYNLLNFQGGVDTLLATITVPTGIVKQLRFILGPNNTIKDNGTVYPLTIPSGAESGLKIKLSKELRAPLETLVIDFDAALSIKVEGPGDYKLRPVLKIK